MIAAVPTHFGRFSITDGGHNDAVRAVLWALPVARVALTPASGPAYTVLGYGTDRVVLEGTVAALNTALAGLVLQTTEELRGPFWVHLMVDDLGRGGFGGGMNASGVLEGTVKTNQCHARPCEHEALCVPSLTAEGAPAFHCQCRAGYSGTLCDTGRCGSGFPCMNGGTCLANVCECPWPFRGVYCELTARPCVGSPCQNGARCEVMDGQDAPTCHCVSPWRGPLCDLHPSWTGASHTMALLLSQPRSKVSEAWFCGLLAGLMARVSPSQCRVRKVAEMGSNSRIYFQIQHLDAAGGEDAEAWTRHIMAAFLTPGNLLARLWVPGPDSAAIFPREQMVPVTATLAAEPGCTGGKQRVYLCLRSAVESAQDALQQCLKNNNEGQSPAAPQAGCPVATYCPGLDLDASPDCFEVDDDTLL